MLESGTRMLNVPYKGGGVALSDMIAGITQVMFPQLPAVCLANSGDVKPLAVTSRYRLSQPRMCRLERDGAARLPCHQLERAHPARTDRMTCAALSDALVDTIKNDMQLSDKMAALGVEQVGEGAEEEER